MPESPLSKVRQHLRQLKNDRSNGWEQYWSEVKQYVTPERGRGIGGSYSETESNNGYQKDGKRLNGTTSRALNTLASGMQSGLTSKARQWFMLSHQDPELSRYKPVREWYDTVQEILEGIFARSNLYSSLLNTYMEMGAFGQGALAVLDHPSRILHCRAYTTGTYYLAADQWGDIDTFMHVEWLTARQLVALYGEDKLPQYVKNAYKNGRKEDRFEVVNAILSHPEEYGIVPPRNLPVASVHFLAKSGDNDDFLRVSGYESFPIMTPRWNTIDTDVYGWAPLRDVLGDAKMLQSMEMDVLKGIKKSVNPPWRIPPELERRGLNTQPGGLNVVSSMGDQAVSPLFTQQINVQQLLVKEQAVEQGIKDGLYNSLFLALLTQDNPQMTAREVAERHEEKLLMLGPVLERIHLELLNPLIDRAFLIAWNAGLVPPPPEELNGQPTQIEYVSILSQAQKAVGVNRIEQSLQFLGGAAQLYPELRHAIDPHKMYSEYNRLIGVRADIFTSDEEYEKAVQQEQQQQQAAAAAQTGQVTADAVKALSESDAANVRELLSGAQGGLVL